MLANQDWDIQPRGLACAVCQKPFADRQTYVSQLLLGAEGYARRDYCGECWAREGASQPGGFSLWKAVFHPPPPPEPEPLKKETAESLLRSLIEKNDPIHKNVIFILAVMLERRRILVERDVQTRPDGAMMRVYEHRQTGETILVADPQLDLNRLGQVQEEVLAMLEAKPETPEATETPPPETPASPATAAPPNVQPEQSN
jgi:hypothetical protein